MVDLLNFCCPGIQFYLLFSPNLCFIFFFISFDLYVLRDDASISKGSFMRTKPLCVLILI